MGAFAKVCLSALVLAAPVAVKPEYRAFLLKIENPRTGATREVQSTLDHIQYRRLYPLENDETVTYLDSWMCWENTGGFQPICPRPVR
jgi:hypothetical protein